MPCFPYDIIDISFLVTPLEDQSSSSSLKFKVNACRVNQASIKAFEFQSGDSTFAPRKYEKWHMAFPTSL